MSSRDSNQAVSGVSRRKAEPHDWATAPQPDLEATIAKFKALFPGWWYSVCECQVSCDASCAPTTESPDVELIDLDSAFDHGFHADLAQPSSLAGALLDVMAQAMAARLRLRTPPPASPKSREAA